MFWIYKPFWTSLFLIVKLFYLLPVCVLLTSVFFTNFPPAFIAYHRLGEGIQGTGLCVEPLPSTVPIFYVITQGLAFCVFCPHMPHVRLLRGGHFAYSALEPEPLMRCAG